MRIQKALTRGNETKEQKRKMLYLMHVPWGWIKQRPHFLAIVLCRYFDVTVGYPHPFRKIPLVRNEIPSNIIDVKEYFVVPYTGQFPFLRRFNLLLKYQLNKLHPEIVWFTHPSLFLQFKGYVPKDAIVIYDCMDDALEFPSAQTNMRIRRNFLKAEEDLIERSNYVIASAEYLRSRIMERHKLRQKVKVIRNALSIDGNANKGIFHIENLLTDEQRMIFYKSKLKILYTGTIAEWMDFPLLIESLERYPELCYILVGISSIRVPRHKRLLYCNAVEHRFLFSISQQVDALVMPFKLTELVHSVNPVKLYEYVLWNKPAIAIEYEETKLFAEYIFLYQTKQDYLEHIQELIEGKYSANANDESRKKFIEQNLWEKRGLEIVEMIEGNNLHSKCGSNI